MRVLIALGGNALLRRGQIPDSDVQEANIAVAAHAVAQVAREHEVIVTHGNGPQVGMLALESAADHALTHAYPLDVLGAQTQGMIGYLLAQALQNELPGRQIATLLTQTLVSAAGPAFDHPAKFVGPVYHEEEARLLAKEHGYRIAPDGPYWRRVVPSPEPLRVVEAPVISTLIAAGTLVVCAGGGGVPVVRDDETGRLRGVEAVVDKDLTSALLAEALEADALLMLTDVPCVQHDYGTGRAGAIRRATPAQLRAGHFAEGSMGPKVDAACRFAESTGAAAYIGALADAPAVLRDECGTRISTRT